MFKQIDSSRSLKDVSDEIREYWKISGTQEISIKGRETGKRFRFLEGPPTANGRPHLGHAMTRTVKDVILRYKYMTGHRIEGRFGGWDCHGLPVEVEAEKHFSINSKKEIEKFGVENFNKYCRESVFRYIDEWKEVDDLLGFWIDHNRDYITLTKEYMESVWWALKELYTKNLLFKDYKIVPYCPRCGTPLSSHEVALGYDDVTDTSVYVKFSLLDSENTFILAWTTTPWTLPSNQFLAVNPEFDYALVEHDGEKYYVAYELVSRIFGDSATVIKKISGKEMKGMRYRQLMPFLSLGQADLQVVTDSFVTLEDGTGVVHISPAFGADDYEIGKRMKTKVVNPVNTEGKYEDQKLPWFGMGVMEANPHIVDYLKKEGVLFRTQKIKHTYPFCYRCHSPLIYYALDSWFIGVSSKRKEILETNQLISWYPDYLKNGRFGNFLEEAKDWSLSRNRYWGTPLPIWTCPKGHHEAVGNTEELFNLSGVMLKDMHRPFVDEVVFKCRSCGEVMHREPYVIDTWFDSGSAPYAAFNYPADNANLKIPVDFITEAIDQTRGWYYTMHVISTLLFGKNAFSNVLTIEFVLDAKGRKMSKSEGNSVLAKEALSEMSPDSLRLFFMFGVPWKTRNYDVRLISEISRKTLLTLINVYSFFSSNANLDHYNFSGRVETSDILDKWILSRLHSTIRACSNYMEAYQPHEALKSIMDLIDQISNNYLRFSRRKFWSETMSDEKEAAYSVLYHTIEMTSKLLAPLAPFASEYIFMALTGRKSVHLEGYPSYDPSRIDEELESDLAKALSVVETVRRMRQKANIKGRQPLSELLISGGNKMSDEILNIIKPEINCKEIVFINEENAPVRRRIRLNYQKVAPVLKDKLSVVERMTNEADSDQLYETIRKDKQTNIAGFSLGPDDFIIDTSPEEGYSMDRDNVIGATLFLNVKIDPSLSREGLAREIIRRIQVMRKDMKLDYDDRIMVEIGADKNTENEIGEMMDFIKSETLAECIQFRQNHGKVWELDGTRITVNISRSEEI